MGVWVNTWMSKLPADEWLSRRAEVYVFCNFLAKFEPQQEAILKAEDARIAAEAQCPADFELPIWRHETGCTNYIPEVVAVAEAEVPKAWRNTDHGTASLRTLWSRVIIPWKMQRCIPTC